jgi:hypothetical protein
MKLNKPLKCLGKATITMLLPVCLLGIFSQKAYSIDTISLDGSAFYGELDSDDLILKRNGAFTEGYSFEGYKGTDIVITMISSDLDSRVFLSGPNGDIFADDDDGAGGKNSWLKVELPENGLYTIYASTYKSGSIGSYTISAYKSTCEGELFPEVRLPGSLVPSNATTPVDVDINNSDRYVQVTNYASDPAYSRMEIPKIVPTVITPGIALKDDEIELDVGSDQGFWKGAAFRVGDNRGLCSGTVLLKSVGATASTGIVIRGIALNGMSAQTFLRERDSGEAIVGAISQPEEIKQVVENIQQDEPTTPQVEENRLLEPITPDQGNEKSSHNKKHRRSIWRIIGDWFD